MMSSLTAEQQEKIDLLDKLFGALNVDQLKHLAETEQVVAKLNGTNANPQMLRKMIQEHELLQSNVAMLTTDVASLRADIKDLMKVLNTTLFTVPYSSEFQTLKNKHNVY